VGVGFLLIHANDKLALTLNEYLMVQNFDGFVLQLFFTAGMFAFVFGLNIFASYFYVDFEYGTITVLARYYIERLLHTRQSYFTNRSVAELFTHLWTASQACGRFFGSILKMVSNVAALIFYGIVVFRFDVWAGIFTVIAVPVYFVATVGLGNRISVLQNAYVKYNGEFATVTQEAFENIGNIKAKGVHNFFIGRCVAILRRFKSICVKVMVMNDYINNVTGFIRIIAPLFIIFAAMVFSPSFDRYVGNILVLYINIPLFLGGFAGIHSQYINYKMSKPFLFKLMEFNESPLEDESGVEISTFESLRLTGVKVTFDGGRIITVPDFELKKGEKLMFFGESGIGKSTVFNIIMGFYREYEGTVLINGINLREIKLVSLRRMFGITFQHTNAITLDLRGNILLGAEKNKTELERLIKLTALESQHETKGETILNNKILSGGEKSRLGLSQMLVTEPKVLLIDEAFSNMDEELESKIINDIFKEYPDRAVICISHRNSSKPFFDRVVDFNKL
jgi:ABC-type bacteriocin/lantibiotic exporter with double-glycine peptidase domain